MLLALLLAAGCQRPPVFEGEAVDAPRPAAELIGRNWDGEPFRLSDHRGKVVVVFFGYTYCPDVCPFTLAKMKQLYDRLGSGADEVEVVFASVDPARDTVEKLASYVPNFEPRFFGLHLDPEELDAAIETFDLTVEYGEAGGGGAADGFYYVDHTGTYFVVDREGRLRLTHPPDARVEELLPDVERLLGR